MAILQMESLRLREMKKHPQVHPAPHLTHGNSSIDVCGLDGADGKSQDPLPPPEMGEEGLGLPSGENSFLSAQQLPKRQCFLSGRGMCESKPGKRFVH